MENQAHKSHRPISPIRSLTARASRTQRAPPLRHVILPSFYEINFVQVLPFLALATAVAMKAIPSTPSSTVG
jgi:hypothetical protein